MSYLWWYVIASNRKVAMSVHISDTVYIVGSVHGKFRYRYALVRHSHCFSIPCPPKLCFVCHRIEREGGHNRRGMRNRSVNSRRLRAIRSTWRTHCRKCRVSGATSLTCSPRRIYPFFASACTGKNHTPRLAALLEQVERMRVDGNFRRNSGQVKKKM